MAGIIDWSENGGRTVGPDSGMVGTMKPFSELTARGKLIEVLRWLCVLPAAVLVEIAAEFVVEFVVQCARNAGWDILGDSIIAKSLTLLLFYVLPKSAFVIAGAKTAPRHHSATAIVLTLIGFLFSLMTHIISQHYLAGRRLGMVNFLHLSAESAGAVGGAAYILLQARRNRRPDITA
jgi:hypothetical protein